MTDERFAGHGQPFDVTAPIRSESAQFMASDAAVEVSVRICRYPSAGVAWVWAHVWQPGRVLGYNLDTHACSAHDAAVDSDHVVYATTDVRCTLHRAGAPDDVRSAHVALEAAFHDDAHPPNTPGTVPVRVEAAFTPGAMDASYRGGRRELRGTATALVNVDGKAVRVTGHGHWHEQTQDHPRWLAPFTYVSLRGESFAMVATATPMGTRGYAQRGAETLRVVAADAGEPARSRPLRVELEDGTTVAGTARAVYEGSVYLYGRRRPGSRVVVDEAGLVGTINDWKVDG